MNRTELIKQRVNALMHAKREYEQASRQYHKAAFMLLYGENKNRNHLTENEKNIIRRGIITMKRAFMANRVMSKSLPASLRRNILRLAGLS